MEYVTTKEVCNRLKIARVTLFRWQRNGVVPQPVRPGGGRFVRWKWEEVEAAINKQEEDKK